jgi:hypothetical protein
MGANISALVEGFGGVASTLLLTVAGGILMSRAQRHILQASWCFRLALISLGSYPVLWARKAPPDTAPWIWMSAVGVCGALVGLGFYLVGLWYRLEGEHEAKPPDDAGI